MRKLFAIKKNRIIGLLIFLAFYLGAMGFAWYAHRLSTALDSQFMAERWQGDTDEKFAQISCFMPSDEKLQLSSVSSFRTKMVSKLTEASVDISDGVPFTDCWSCEDSAKVYGAGSGTADIIACGGDFFDFHPLQLVTGNYFSGDDLMQDNVLLDEDLAWLLFGGNDLEGQIVYIYNTPFRVAGVVAREGDQGTEKAYQGGMGLFMSYQTYYDLNTSDSSDSSSSSDNIGIACYEVCMPNPVKGFALGVVEDAFSDSKAEVVQNTDRFRFSGLVTIIKDFSLRSIHSGVTYAYWENAARYLENKAAIMLIVSMLLMLVPVLMLLSALLLNFMWTAHTIREDVLPQVSGAVEEEIRKVERHRLENVENRHHRGKNRDGSKENLDGSKENGNE